jgi:hypothetical protein
MDRFYLEGLRKITRILVIIVPPAEILTGQFPNTIQDILFFGGNKYGDLTLQVKGVWNLRH